MAFLQNTVGVGDGERSLLNGIGSAGSYGSVVLVQVNEVSQKVKKYCNVCNPSCVLRMSIPELKVSYFSLRCTSSSR